MSEYTQRLDAIEEQMKINNEIISRLITIVEIIANKIVDSTPIIIELRDKRVENNIEQIKLEEFNRGYNQARNLYNKG